MKNKRLAVFLVCGSLAVGCKTPFSTRNPEEPISSQSTWIQPTAPEYVLVNLRNSLAEKNSTNYLRCLADSSNSGQTFRYTADPAVANAHPSLFETWDKLSETNFINQLLLFLAPDSTVQLVLTPSQSTGIEDNNRITFYQNYQLTVNHSCSNADCPRYVAGQCELILFRNSESLWTIVGWSDQSTGDTPTWSQLRAYFGK
ncbi:hypothetical protein JW992_15735 [candidate division KSB1 bacterium]|nr:hypothetical protein [candidate division KSB1 bacterium]